MQESCEYKAKKKKIFGWTQKKTNNDKMINTMKKKKRIHDIMQQEN